LILTLTINPAIDRNVRADRLAFEDRGYILDTSESPGGRGINASRVLHCFGAKTLAIVTSGGKVGRRFEQLLAKSHFPTEVVPIEDEMRTNLTISDRQGLTIKLNEFGPTLSQDELHAVHAAVERHLDQATWLMICGSLPPGVPANFYCALVEQARRKGVKTLLDTDGEALIEGLEAQPAVVTPNQNEAERLLSRALITRNHFFEAVERIHAMGAEQAIISLGSRGAVGLCGDSLIEVVPPRVEAVSPIGAGDALAAAFVWSLDRGDRFRDALHWGVAAGTASAMLPGVTFATLEQAAEVRKSTEVRQVTRRDTATLSTA
jgi:1-phosphofructokinase family hexose kinase